MKKQRLKRLYAPYIKQGKRWIRATNKDGTQKPSLFKDRAVILYQNWLLAPFLDGVDEIRSLRPVPVSSKEYDSYLFFVERYGDKI